MYDSVCLKMILKKASHKWFWNTVCQTKIIVIHTCNGLVTFLVARETIGQKKKIKRKVLTVVFCSMYNFWVLWGTQEHCSELYLSIVQFPDICIKAKITNYNCRCVGWDKVGFLPIRNNQVWISDYS